MFIRLAYLNVLWVFFTVLGLGLFGFFPATIAVFSIVRSWMREDKDIPMFKTFWIVFKKEFLKGNLLGLVHIFIGVILYVDILYFTDPITLTELMLYYVFRIIMFVYVIFTFHLFPVYVHYETKWWKYYRSTFAVILMRPLTILAMIMIGLLAVIVFRILPGLMPFFLCSGPVYTIMLVCYPSLEKSQQQEEVG